MKTYSTFKEFLADIDRSERVFGHTRGIIIDTITRELLGHWNMAAGATVTVRWV